MLFKNSCRITSLNLVKGKISGKYPITLQSALSNNTSSIEKSLNAISSIDNKVNKIQDANLTTSLNIVQLQQDMSNLKNSSTSDLTKENTSYLNYDDTMSARTIGMKVVGKTLSNLCNVDSYDLTAPIEKQDDCFLFNSNGSFTFKNFVSKDKNLKPSTQYTIIYKVIENTLKGDTSVEVCNNTNYIQKIQLNANTLPGLYKQTVMTKASLAPNEMGHAIYFNSLKNNVVGQKIKFWIIVLEGNYLDNSWFPYFKGLVSFGDKSENKITYRSHGVNLFDVSKAKNELLNVENGGTFVTDTSSTSDFIRIKKGSSYVINSEKGDIRGWYGVIYDTTKEFVKQKTFEKNIPFVADMDGYFRFSFASGNDGNPAINITMVESNKKDTPYIPYEEKLVEIQLEGNLKGINDKAYDYITEEDDGVKLYKCIGDYTFKGTEQVYITEVRENTVLCSVKVPEVPAGLNNNDNCISDKMGLRMGCYSNDVVGFFGTCDGICLSLAKTDLSSQDEQGVQEWLKNNKPTYYYQLAKPTISNISNIMDIELDTFKNGTVIEVLNSIKGNLSFEVQNNIQVIIKNLNKTITKLFNSLNEIINKKGE